MASTQNAADSTPSTPGGAGLPQFLESIKTTAVGEAYAELQRSHLAHYEAAGEELTRERLADLFDLVVRAIRDRDLTPVGAFSEQVAHDRFEAGFDIAEVQAAFNTLEETLWRRIVAVSQFYHLPRIKLAYRRAGWDVLTVPAKSTERTLYQVAREVPAFWVYYVRALFG